MHGEGEQVEDSPYFDAEHRLLRDSLNRFVSEEVLPNGAAWEVAGEVPRAVLRRMGELGFLGIRYPERFGGSELNSLASVVLAEALGRSTFGGFAATVLVHTDMASPHLMIAGSRAELDRYMPGIVSGELIAAVAVTEPDAGSDVASMRNRARRRFAGCRRADHQGVQRRSDPSRIHHLRPEFGIRSSMFLCHLHEFTAASATSA